MDKSIKRGLNDRIYDKRKAAALELERVVKECVNNHDDEKIHLIIKQLRNDYAYAVHQPNARYGGLIGLAAVAIALGQNEVPKYLESIMHPVLACFGDHDSMVRYFACEALYNIAKVSKGEILLYFNEIFDVLCKLVADVELSVKNAADILDRLIKDIVSEKASTYISVLTVPNFESLANAKVLDQKTGKTLQYYDSQTPKAFSLSKFIPLLKERMFATNPYTRMFLVSWLRLLDSIPDLELISYLPSFLDPLLSYLSSSLEDVRVVTENFLKLLLLEIKRIYEIKKIVKDREIEKEIIEKSSVNNNHNNNNNNNNNNNSDNNPDNESMEIINHQDNEINDIYLPGQDVFIDCSKIIDILVTNLDSPEEMIQFMSLEWLINLLEISPESFILLMPKLLSILLAIISHNNQQLELMAVGLNSKLMALASTNKYDINYTLIVNQLTLQLLNDKQSTRLTSLDWLIMLHEKNPKKFLEHSDNTIVTLLKTLNDKSEKVIDKDLELLSKISNQTDDKYFHSFMIDLLNLFKKDRKLLDTRADFIVRTICKSLNSERVYKSISKVLYSEENNLIFVSIMIQILNNNLIIAPELLTLRKKLINFESAELFKNLFECWSLNSPSLLTLTLLTSNYKLSYKIVLQMVEYELSLNILIQLDLLIQLLESPIFAKLRLDLLNPKKNLYLFRCLYGLLMLLPQSNSFKILQNRLNSISPIINLQVDQDSNTEGDETEIKSDKNDDELLECFKKSQKKLEEFKLKNKQSTSELEFENKDDISSYFKNDEPIETSSILEVPKKNDILLKFHKNK